MAIIASSPRLDYLWHPGFTITSRGRKREWRRLSADSIMWAPPAKAISSAMCVCVHLPQTHTLWFHISAPSSVLENAFWHQHFNSYFILTLEFIKFSSLEPVSNICLFTASEALTHQHFGCTSLPPLWNSTGSQVHVYHLSMYTHTLYIAKRVEIFSLYYSLLCND